MCNNHEMLKKEMEEYLGQFDNLIDVPMATLTEEQREVLTEIAKERYGDLIKPNGFSIPPDIPFRKYNYKLPDKENKQ